MSMPLLEQVNFNWPTCTKERAVLLLLLLMQLRLACSSQ